MEAALKIWQEEKMPELKLKTPWYGYPLGLWDEQDDQLAEAVARGDYFHSKPVKRNH
jgi:4-hydroxy-3-polyprenylbenzoate decarboxylase